jgi:hypothetical protein
VVVLLWQWFQRCCPVQARQHWKIIDDHGLWEQCLVAEVPILSLVLTTSWARAMHEDKVAAPLFGIWLDGRGGQTGGNFGFPSFGWRHGDVPKGRIRAAAWDGSIPHCTTEISDGGGRMSVAILLSQKTLNAALCSKRRQRDAEVIVRSPSNTGRASCCIQ